MSTPIPWPSEASASKAGVLIGREADNDFVLDMPTVSGYHALVIDEGPSSGLWVEDLGSSNGTSINAPDRKITRSPLKATDTLYLGSHPIPAAILVTRIAVTNATPRLVFAGPEIVIGRDSRCDHVVDSAQVSGRHARLFRAGDQLWIEDLASSNGTYVNGRRIEKRATVSAGDRISLGSYALILSVDSAAAPSKAPTPVREPQATAAARAPTSWFSVDTGATKPRSPSPLLLGALALQAPVIAIAIVLLLGASRSTPATAEEWSSHSRTIANVLAWVGLAAIWFGISNAVLSQMLDAPRLWNGLRTSGGAALLANLGGLALLSVLQCLVVWLIVAYGAGLKAPAGSSLVLLGLASLVGLGLGTLLLMLVPRPAAIGVAIAVMLVLFLLGRGPQAVPTNNVSRAISSVCPSRWVFEGLILLESERTPAPKAIESESGDLAESYFPVRTDRSGGMAAALALGLTFVGLFAAIALISWAWELPEPSRSTA
jgi:pSer/pThr/pTyr-binding forkhead associated (FHA) protein